MRSIINGTLDADSISKSASVSAGGNLVLGGDHVGGQVAVSDHGNVTAGKTITIQKNSETTVVFTAKSSASASTDFTLGSNANQLAASLATVVNNHASFSATVSGANVLVSSTDGGKITISSTDAARLTTSNLASFTNAEKITFTSAGDDSARLFTIIGTDAMGNTQIEDVTGGNSKAVTSTKYFKTVTQISVDSGGNTAGAVTVGVVNKEVKTIVSTDKAFAALLKDGSVITWGDSSAGGDSSSVSSKLIMGETNSSAVTSLSSSSGAFSAVKADGSVVTWGNSDLGGDSSGIDFSANKVQGMSGASSGSDCVVNCAANTAKKIGSANLTIKDSGGSTVSGTFITGSDGKLDTSGLSDGTYTASYSLSDSQADSIINSLDVSGVLDVSSSINTSPTSKQKVAADLNQDGNINALDVSAVLDKAAQIDNSGVTAVLRVASESDPFTNKTFSVSSGSDLILSAHVLGDFNGSYADIL